MNKNTTIGIIIPQVKTQEEAEYAAHFAKYAPLGGRSVGISRAHGYGMTFSIKTNQYTNPYKFNSL
ncbi:MAG: hypothetical protein KGY70_06425 [Bacteroidales bacterium]|nr:hypothetical protein [Bacteroidales bacterium]MBS3774801.1 hypothetical protein [Bacteroidales bacterium]